MLESLKAELDRLDIEKRDIDRKINFRKDILVSFPQTGLTGDTIPASLEDLDGFEFDFNFEDPPLVFFYDRRWVGFPELTEYDHKQEFILPMHYKFKEEQ
jgi:hypothetical protein